jgi:hypothetical protein
MDAKSGSHSMANRRIAKLGDPAGNECLHTSRAPRGLRLSMYSKMASRSAKARGV